MPGLCRCVSVALNRVAALRHGLESNIQIYVGNRRNPMIFLKLELIIGENQGNICMDGHR